MVILLLLLALPLISTIFLFSIQNKPRQNTTHRPPGPKGLPLIGNIHQIDLPKLHLYLTNLSHKYGPLFSLSLSQVPALVISSADAAKKALKQNDVAFCGRPITTASIRLSYNNSGILCSTYSLYWKQMRKMVVHHLFSSQKVRSFRPVREDEVSSMINEISKRAASHQPINLGEVAMSFSNNILCRVAFGKRLDEGQMKLIGKLVPQFGVFAIENLLADCLPLFGLTHKLLGVDRRLEKLFADMDSLYQQLIDEHLNPERPGSMKDDIIDFLIQLRDDDSAPVKIDWTHIKAILMDVLIAGTDTVANSIIWAITTLIKNPSIMKKVQQEIRSLDGKKCIIDEDDIDRLPYLTAVIKEVLRLYPAVSIIPRATTERCIVDGYEIQPTTIVFVNVWAINRDPECWENPNDFVPDRFVNSTIDFKEYDFGFIPFGAGRRICPGMHLGVANISIALANLLYSFDWLIPDGMTEQDIDTEAIIGITLHKKNPLCLIPKNYNG